MALSFKIPFNKPFIIGDEIQYINRAVKSGKLSGNGIYTQKCHKFFENKYLFKKTLLTTSCTDALEMAAILADIKEGDEVIVPAYTFVSTALAFVRQGARIVFTESRSDHPGIDEQRIEELITARTRAIIPVHYAGVACDMDVIMQIAKKYNLIVVEDAAHAIASYYKEKSLGSIGHLSTFSFHETKNIQCGEGGMLGINDEQFIKRAEIIWEKGTNRAEFFRGEVNKYGWVDVGSSFLPSELNAAFLWAQIENLNKIQNRRIEIWAQYYNGMKLLETKSFFKLPVIPEYATNNGHLFYLVCNSLEERTSLINFLKSKGILSVFHYLGLHKSQFYSVKHDGRILLNTDRYTDCLVRLPLFYELTNNEVDYIISCIFSFFKK